MRSMSAAIIHHNAPLATVFAEMTPVPYGRITMVRTTVYSQVR